MKNNSIWESLTKNDKKENNNNFLKNKINTDILIIGGGLTGLTTAYFLKDSKKRITIIDKSMIGHGVTSKTTAKITYLQQDTYSKIASMHNEKIAKKYYDSQKDATSLIVKIIKDNNIDCDLERVDSILFTNEDKNIKKVVKEKELLMKWKENIKDYSNKKIKYGFIVKNTYTFNPLKYLYSVKDIISKKVSIYENTIAKSIEKENDIYQVKTNNGVIKTKVVVLACHYPFFIYPLFLPFKTHIEREYVNAAKVKNYKNITMINVDKDLYSLRYYKNNLIYGSNSHMLTNKINYQNNYQKSRKEFYDNFKLKPTYTWMNQDIISNDLLPFIGEIKENIYISTAYNTWGMTNGTIGGKIIADLILDKDNKYQSLFNPNRINISLVTSSIIGIFPYIKVYIESIFHKSNPYYIKIKGIIYGVYIDELGVKHKVKLLCPHMKCPLVFNREEKTWDCPCHGSRFTIDGDIIETPAVKNIKE